MKNDVSEIIQPLSKSFKNSKSFNILVNSVILKSTKAFQKLIKYLAVKVLDLKFFNYHC